MGQSSRRQLASAASLVISFVSGSPSWYICSWWQPSGRLRLAVVLLKPEGRLKLRSAAAPLSGLTTSCRLGGQPSPKLSSSCTLTRTVASGDSATDDGSGGGSSDGDVTSGGTAEVRGVGG